uniref:GAIN-B domain-containing protein n=1 Tax=Sus scrofa TaxID=9823 RepID=A0A4X1V052_PIG
MEMPRALGVLLLLHLASGKRNVLAVTEQPRKVCEGLDHANQYDNFGLEDTAKCFAKCTQSGNESCNLGNLQRYWLSYEVHLVETSPKDTVNMSFLKALVLNISTNISKDLHFSLAASQIPRQVTEDEHQHPDRVRLPRSLFESLQGSKPTVRLAITILDIGPGTLFKGPQLSTADGSSVLNNRLVGLSLGRIPVTQLAEPLEITFSHQHQPPNMTLSCVFWDVNKGSSGDWSSKGCSTNLGANRTVCRCDHLTFFALLLVTAPLPRSRQCPWGQDSWLGAREGRFCCLAGVGAFGECRPGLQRMGSSLRASPTEADLGQGHRRALTRISQAGCGTSMIFLAFSIVLYALLRSVTLIPTPHLSLALKGGIGAGKKPAG